MSRFGRNAVANLTGQIIVAAVQLLMIPLYVRFVGIEAWGLFGFYLSVQAFAQLLDFGMSATVNRQLARYSARGEVDRARDFVRTSELAYGAIGVAIGLAIFLAAPAIAHRWFQLVSLSPESVVTALRLIAALTAVQWPLTFYQGALFGLNRHVAVNLVRVAATVLAATGAVVLLRWVSPTISAFFAWQVLVALVQVGAMAWALWQALPAGATAARVVPSIVLEVRHFAYGMTALTATATLLGQLDRIVLTRVVPLEQFGYYTLAAVAGQGLNTLVSALLGAVFPLFARLVATGDAAALRHQYVRMCGLMTALTVPLGAVVVAFGTEVVLAWTGNTRTAGIAGPIAALLVIGSAIGGLMAPAHTLQVAHGETRTLLAVNVVACTLQFGLLLVLPQRYGILGAAGGWPLVMGVACVLTMGLTARRFEAAATGAWMARVVILPAAAAVFVVVFFRFLLPTASARPLLALELAGVWTAAAGALLVTNRPLLAEFMAAGRRLTGPPAGEVGTPGQSGL